MNFDKIINQPLPSQMAKSECGDDDMATPAVLPVVDTEEVIDVAPTELTPDEEKRVDDTITGVVATSLVKDELVEESYVDYVESSDYEDAMDEGYFSERTIVKFDKNARRSQLYEVAVLAIAREKEDNLYKKLETVYKMERTIKKQLRKKYHALAVKRVKEWMLRAKKSKSNTISKIANKLLKKDK